MNSKLQARIDRLESSRKKLFAALGQYQDAVLNKKPSAASWSAVQVMDHLMESESASLRSC